MVVFGDTTINLGGTGSGSCGGAASFTRSCARRRWLGLRVIWVYVVEDVVLPLILFTFNVSAVRSTGDTRGGSIVNGGIGVGGGSCIGG